MSHQISNSPHSTTSSSQISKSILTNHGLSHPSSHDNDLSKIQQPQPSTFYLNSEEFTSEFHSLYPSKRSLEHSSFWPSTNSQGWSSMDSLGPSPELLLTQSFGQISLNSSKQTSKYSLPQSASNLGQSSTQSSTQPSIQPTPRAALISGLKNATDRRQQQIQQQQQQQNIYTVGPQGQRIWSPFQEYPGIQRVASPSKTGIPYSYGFSSPTRTGSPTPLNCNLVFDSSDNAASPSSMHVSYQAKQREHQALSLLIAQQRERLKLAINDGSQDLKGTQLTPSTLPSHHSQHQWLHEKLLTSPSLPSLNLYNHTSKIQSSVQDITSNYSSHNSRPSWSHTQRSSSFPSIYEKPNNLSQTCPHTNVPIDFTNSTFVSSSDPLPGFGNCKTSSFSTNLYATSFKKPVYTRDLNSTPPIHQTQSLKPSNELKQTPQNFEKAKVDEILSDSSIFTSADR